MGGNAGLAWTCRSVAPKPLAATPLCRHTCQHISCHRPQDTGWRQRAAPVPGCRASATAAAAPTAASCSVLEAHEVQEAIQHVEAPASPSVPVPVDVCYVESLPAAVRTPALCCSLDAAHARHLGAAHNRCINPIDRVGQQSHFEYCD